MVGKTLGHYEILEPLGAGGMGEVYRARDTKLDRDVAIKVLPEDLAQHPDRLARFEREAKLLAALNHANIGSIYGLDESGGIRFLVLELIEGETLEQRLSRGAIPVPEALDIARQIAEALEAAHDAGIIHRDVKPANVLLADGSGVKVLDFGIAKGTAVEASAALTEQATNLTIDGTLMGTPPYMAPEQIRGVEADKRADIWAFGCVLYEMLTGRGAFVRETVADTLVAVLEAEPDWRALPNGTPPSVAALLRRCLRKVVARRVRDIGDARIELADLIDYPNELEPISESAERAPAARLAMIAPWVVAAAAVVVGIWTVFGVNDPRPGGRMEIGLPVGMVIPFIRIDAPSVAVSLDGSMIAFVALPVEYAHRATPSQYLIHVRRVGESESRALEGTEGGHSPFFSPDGQWMGFFADGTLKKIPVGGGGAVAICIAPQGYGGVWTEDGDILFTPEMSSAIWRVASDADSTPVQLSKVDVAKGESDHDWPYLLPGGRSALFTIWRGDKWPDSDIGFLDLETGEHRVVQGLGVYPAYVEPGFLVYARFDQLFAVPFDAETGETSGTPMVVVDGVLSPEPELTTHFAMSPRGALVFAPGGRVARERDVVWLERDGSTTAIDAEGRFSGVNGVSVSPDGRLLAFGATSDGFDIRVFDFETGAIKVVVNTPAWEAFPIWSPSGQQLVYSSDHEGGKNLYTVDRLDGDRSEALVAAAGGNRQATAWANGWIAYTQTGGEGGSADLWLLELAGDGAPVPLATTGAVEDDAIFSPDGKWVAFVTDISGRKEVQISPMPPTGDTWPVSGGGGDRVSSWTAEGLVYFNPENRREMRVTIDDNGGASIPEPYTAAEPEGFDGLATDPRTGRAIGVLMDPAALIGWLVVWPDWGDELQRLMEAGR